MAEVEKWEKGMASLQGEKCSLDSYKVGVVVNVSGFFVSWYENREIKKGENGVRNDSCEFEDKMEGRGTEVAPMQSIV